MKTLSLCLIVTAEDFKKALPAIEQIKPFVNEVCITVTDRTEGYEDGDKLKFSYFKWINDFAAARNYNFSQSSCDWILWLDADDTLANPEKLKGLVQYAEDNRVEGYYFLYKYDFDASGKCINEHWKAQLLKNNGHFKWKGAIHEDPIQERPARWAKAYDCVRIHHSDHKRGKESSERNMRILLKERERDPKEPRTLFYLGRGYIELEEYQKAIDCLTEYLALSGWDDERYEARLLIGSCFMRTKQHEEALGWYNSAILEKEEYPDAYIQKGMAYLKLEKWGQALSNFKTALGMNIPDASTYFNPMLYKRDLFLGIAFAYLQIAELDQALPAVLQAEKADPKYQETLDLKKIIVELKFKHDTSNHYARLAKYLKDKNQEDKILPLLSSAPKELLDDPILLSLKFAYQKQYTWPEKSIAVYCGPTAESWTPDSQNNGGIGGSETAVIELTNRLAEDGWNITVYNQCDAPPEGKRYSKVLYKNYWTFNVDDEFDVLWVWRLPELFDYDLNARLKILDLHDTMSPADFTPERVAKMDKIFVKTNFHRSLYPKIADDKFVIVGNGIDLKRFEGKAEKDPHRFMYSSTPNRGLDTLLKMWPKIKEKIPEATLHVYYGWNTFYKLEKNNPERMMWMKKVQEMMKQDGVVDHGRVGQKELAQDMLKTSFWLYPTDFPEIDCITAKEMQAAGVYPITSGYAALEESQISGMKVRGDTYDPEWQKEYIKEVVSYKDAEINHEHIKTLSKQFSWDNVAQVWKEQLNGESYNKELGRDSASTEGEISN